MKTNKIVGLLLAGSMFASSLPVFAAATVDTDKDKYGFGDEVTITTDAYERIVVKNADGDIIVMGTSELNDGAWEYSFKIPKKNADDYQQAGKWVNGKTYTVVAGSDADYDTCTFKIDDDGDDATENANMKITFESKSATVKTFKKLVSFKLKNYDSADKITVEYEVEKSSKTLEAGSDYEVKFDGDKYDDATEFETTAKLLNQEELYFWFKTSGTYTVKVTLTDADGNESTKSQKVTVSTSSSTSGTTTSTSGTSYNTGTWYPGLTSGVSVQLNPSQHTKYGVSTNVAYTASTPSNGTFNIGVTVDGVNTTEFNGFDPVYVQIPYTTNVTDTTTLIVRDGNGNIVPRSLYKDGKMYMNVSSIVNPYTIASNPVSFGDVYHDWAVQSINALAAREIINGVGEGLYDPDRAVTRAEFTKMIVTMFDVYDSSAVSTFADIDANQWFAPYVATAQKLAITNGYAEDNTFRPNQIISREEMSAMLYRAADVLSVSITAKQNKTEFADDASIQEYAKTPVYKMQQAEVLKGVGNNIFDPQGTCTRAQAAVAIYNMFVLSMSK